MGEKKNAGSSDSEPIVEKKLKEAEVCRSMGLLDESLSICNKLLENKDGIEDEKIRSIEEKIEILKEEIEIQSKENLHKRFSRDLIYRPGNFSEKESAGKFLRRAEALKDIGLVADAAREYEKFFETETVEEDCSSAKVLLGYVSCLLPMNTSEEILDMLGEAAAKLNPDRRELARVYFRTGSAFEKKGDMDGAVSSYKAAAELTPDDENLKRRLDDIGSMLSTSTRFDYLLANKLVTTEQLEEASEISKKTNKSVEYVLVGHFKIDKSDMGKSLSLYYDCPFVAFDPDYCGPVELIRNLKRAFLVHYSWVPLNWSKNGAEILIDDPRDLRKTDHIRALMATSKINYFVGIREDIVKFIDVFFGSKKESEEDLLKKIDTLVPHITFDEVEEKEEDLRDIFDESSGQIVRYVDQVLVTAFRDRASDIHFEPSPITGKTTIRFRVDGVCHEYMQIPNAMIGGVISRLKIMAGLDIAERRLPQDGKIKMRRKGIPLFELRMSTMPTAGGFEDAVLRILARAGAMKLDDVGLLKRNYEIFEKIVSSPYGIILVVGPTGSGKTTTLHAALGYLNRPEIKIWTAEDPVEITQKGLRQVEAKPKIGLNFARIMRGFLRLDPDVIMIGEMRDQETASIGVEASLTGHLVFSTLHTISAPETITRLIDMGVNALNFSDAFLGVLAQRLVRRLCKKCREAYRPTEQEFQDMVGEYGGKAFEKSGLAYESDTIFYRPVGCEECSGAGYRGRIGIHELMEGTTEIKRLIKKKSSTEEVFEQAFKDGMTTLKQDGIQKVFMGYTDFMEIRRVVSK